MREVSTNLNGTCHCGTTQWVFSGDPGSITACNCTLCRRYGALWAYDYEDERISISGPTSAYVRVDEADPKLEVRFCSKCACVLCWRGLKVDADRRRRIAVNIRLAAPEAVSALPIDHFDGFDTFEDLPRDERCVRDLWF